jgi:1-acyl-sn-glycerol-3-phosphate acyltransferase
MSQLQLLRDRSSWPLFWMQFLGILAEYALKCALLLAILPRAREFAWSGLGLVMTAGIAAAGAGALAASLTAHFARARDARGLMRRTRLLEVGAVSVGIGALLVPHPWLTVGALALVAAHASATEVLKLDLLPRLSAKDELPSANALFTSGGFLAAFLGIALGSAVLLGADGSRLIAAVLAVTTLGSVLFAAVIPDTGVFQERPETSTRRWLVENFEALRGQRSLLLACLGIAWFWFFAVAMALAVAGYTGSALDGDGRIAVVGFLLYCLGTTLGAFICDRLSLERLELGVVPLASLGITLFLLDLTLAGAPVPQLAEPWPQVLGQLLTPAFVRVAIDLAALGFFTGLYLVPLRTLIQLRAKSEQRVQVLAASQMLSAAFMIFALLLFGRVFVSTWPPLPFVALLVLNACVSFYVYRVLPEFLLRFVLWCVSRVMYRVRVLGAEFLPAEGACVIVCNHVSFVDWMLIAAACPRPVRFVMYHRFLGLPLIGFLMRDAQVIPIAPAHEDAGLLDAAFESIATALERGEVVCIFPEGKLTSDGNLSRFRTGIERVIARTPVPVVPMALDGMWGSYFSKKDGEHFQRPFRRFWSKVQLIVGPPISANDVSATKLERIVAGLGGFELPGSR